MFEAVVHPLFLSPDWFPVAGRFYCPVCISQSKPPQAVGWGTRSDVAQHLKVAHEWKRPEPEDALFGQDMVAALAQWRKDVAALVDEFGESLRLVRGVGDFLDECVT